MKLLCMVFAWMCCAVLVQADSPTWKIDPKLNHAFTSQQVQGVFVWFDPSANTLVTNDQARAQKRFPPASTFKIPNTVIGLHTKAVSSVEEVLPYGGKPQFIKAWEQDMNLHDAIRASNVPVYQELARRIGLERMREHIKLFQYGNQTIGNVVDRFWLEGPLEISAAEQTSFLHRYLSGQIPEVKSTIPILKEITLQETNKNSQTLHYKTGWCTATKPATGWLVGWIQHQNQTHFFALNIDMPKVEDAPKRLIITKQILTHLAIW